MTKALCYFIAVFLCYFSSVCFAGEYIIKIDKVTGAFVKQGPAIPDVTWVYLIDRAYDQSTGTYFFPSAQVNHSLCSMDVSSGTLINSPTIGSILLFQFDNAAGILYGMQQETATNTKHFISINPVTGSFTQIGNALPGSALYHGNYCTFDQKNHIYYFVDPPNNVLCGIDAATGMVISSATLSLPVGETLNNIAYDSTTATMHALVSSSGNWFYLAVVNTSTGVVSHLGWGTEKANGNASATIDEANQEYILLYSSPEAGGHAITTIDIATGNVLHNALVQPFTTGGDNAYSIVCDKTTSNLYAIHWESENTEVPSPLSENSSIVYPTPVHDLAIIQCSNPNKEDRKLALYNSLGQIVTTIDHITSDKVQLNCYGYPAGFYYYQLKNRMGIVSTGRIVIE